MNSAASIDISPENSNFALPKVGMKALADADIPDLIFVSRIEGIKTLASADMPGLFCVGTCGVVTFCPGMYSLALPDNIDDDDDEYCNGAFVCGREG